MGSFRRRVVGVLMVGLATGGGPAGSLAAPVNDLYTVQVIVDPQAEDPREDGFQRAMGELLVRLTGRRDAAADPELLNLVEAAARFVQRWGFIDAEQLSVTFDGRAAEAELARRDQPVWSQDRPLTLVWIALDAGGGDRRLLNGLEGPVADVTEDEELAAAVLTEVAAAAQRRGLPLVYPLLDTEDLALVTFADIWGGFTGRVTDASRRYQADSVLIGRVRANGGVLTARWQFLGTNEQRERRSGVAEGLEWLADIYASQYAVTGGNALTRLVITQVFSFTDYARVISHLEGLSMIDGVDVEAFRGDQLILELQGRGSADVLDRALTLGGILSPQPPPVAQPIAIGLDRATARYFRVLR